MSRELKIDTREWEEALRRLASTSKREAPVVLKGEMKSVLTLVQQITPPASPSVTGTAARKQGEACIARDILSIYGGPSDAYDVIARKNPAAASGFWMLQKQGQMTQAGQIVQAVTDKPFTTFDDGALHQQMRGSRGRVRSRGEFSIFVSDPKRLQDYIRKIQARVFWLAGGWNPAAREVGASVPAMIARHSSPGTIELFIQDTYLALKATNAVSYASFQRDLERRIQWVLDTRKAKLDRAWDYFVAQQARRSGFRVS